MANLVRINLLGNKMIQGLWDGHPLTPEGGYYIVAGENNATIFELSSVPEQYKDDTFTVIGWNAGKKVVNPLAVLKLNDTFYLGRGMAIAGYSQLVFKCKHSDLESGKVEDVVWLPAKIKISNTDPQWADYSDLATEEFLNRFEQLETNIFAETDRAQNKEEQLNNAIQEEIKRAKGAEADILQSAQQYTDTAIQDTNSDLSALDTRVSQAETNIDSIKGKIPTQASESNQLADKAFVNSSINNVAAYYITKNENKEPFQTKAELDDALEYYSGGIPRIPTRNDYAIVVADETHIDTATGVAPTTRYNYDNGWAFQYVVNNSPFTAVQWEALNSGITEEKLSELITNDTKQDTAIQEAQSTAESKYTLPIGGIPSTDIADNAITSEKIEDGTIVNADISDNAEIEQSKIAGLVEALEEKALANDLQTEIERATAREDSIENEFGTLSGNFGTVQEGLTIAQSTAETALSTANSAQSTAESAQSAANKAQSTANNAQTTATDAQSAASSAQSTADDALEAATAAQSTADKAQTTASSKYTKPSGGIPTTDLSEEAQSSLANADSAVQPEDLAKVATSGKYSDLTGLPTIPTIPNITVTDAESGNAITDITANGHTVVISRGETFATQSALDDAKQDIESIRSTAENAVKPSDLADVATSGSYKDLTDKPTIPTIPTISVTTNGSGNAVTAVTASGHTVTITKSETFAKNADLTSLSGRVTTIEGKIPTQASESNQLADKAFVNSSIQTNTANFRGNWDNWASVPSTIDDYPEDYAGSKTPTTNDYMAVKDASGYGTDYKGTWRFKYSGIWGTNGKSGWKPEYQVNETPLTAAQLAALNSGATSTLIGQITTNKNDIAAIKTKNTEQDTAISTAQSTATAANTAAGKAQSTADSKYTLPTTGIPSTDIADGAITSAKIADGTIVNADISSSAAISASKISGLGSLATKNTITSAEITDGTIVNADISANAAIAQSKISGLTSALSGKASASDLAALSSTVDDLGTAVSDAQTAADKAQTTASSKYTKPSGGIPATDLAGNIPTSKISGLATVATSGEYSDLSGLPTIPPAYSLPTATTSVLGGVKLGSDTVQSVGANNPTATAGRTYAVQKNSSGQMVVNVPWTQSSYTLPIATASILGGVKSSTTGTTSGRDYKVQVNTDGTMKVNVPWTDHTYDLSKYLPLAGGTMTGAIKWNSTSLVSKTSPQYFVVIEAFADGGQMKYSSISESAKALGVTAKYSKPSTGIPKSDLSQEVQTLLGYTLPTATSTVLGGVKLGSDTAQTVAANTVTATTNRTYAIQKNSSGQLVVNVPWQDTNTTYDLSKYLPIDGSTAMTGTLSVKGGGSINTSGYVTGTWLATTNATDLGTTPERIAVIGTSGSAKNYIYWRTPSEILTDIGAYAKPSGGIPATDLAGNIPYSKLTGVPSIPAAVRIRSNTNSFLTGDITLSAGSNITLSQSGGTITIASSGGGGGGSGGGASEGGSDEFIGRTFNDMSWDDVIKVLRYRKVREVFRVGDTKLAQLQNSGTEILFTIIDTSGTHDVMAGDYDVSDGNMHSHCEGFAPLTLAMLVAVQDIMSPFNGEDPSGNTTWSESYLRRYLNEVILPDLPSELISYIVPVIKMTALHGADDQHAIMEKTADKLFLFSASEIIGDKGARVRGYTPGDTDTEEFTYAPYIYEGEQYEYFKSVKDGEVPNGRLIFDINKSYQESYWLRTSPDDYTATYVDGDGTIKRESDLSEHSIKYCIFGFCLCDPDHMTLPPSPIE